MVLPAVWSRVSVTATVNLDVTNAYDNIYSVLFTSVQPAEKSRKEVGITSCIVQSVVHHISYLGVIDGTTKLYTAVVHFASTIVHVL